MRRYDVEMVPTDDGTWCLKSEADAYIRQLKRELWLARAERAREKALVFYFAMTESYNLNINGYSNEEKGQIRMRPARWWRITWLKVERKCRAKAEEYK